MESTWLHSLAGGQHGVGLMAVNLLTVELQFTIIIIEATVTATWRLCLVDNSQRLQFRSAPSASIL